MASKWPPSGFQVASECPPSAFQVDSKCFPAAMPLAACYNSCGNAACYMLQFLRQNA